MSSDREQMASRYRKRQSALFRILRPPLLLIHNKAEKLIPHSDGVKLFLGGAGGTVPPGFINIDFENFPGVDVVADVQALPFKTESVAAVECDAVLEHVAEPAKAVSEIIRVLRPGGFLHVLVPFCHPFHGYPSDYQRWTTVGLRHLFPPNSCEIVDLGVRTGPTATLLTFLCEYVKLFGGKVGYAVAAWILWPLRYIDVWLNRQPQAHVLANHIYVLVRKK